jgi:CheY-like chemotaxis protein
MNEDKSVLIVDDEPSNIDLIAGILKPHVKTKAAPKGEIALIICKKAPPNLVLLDLKMPGMDGFEVCTKLTADPATAGIPIVFISGEQDPADVAKGKELGAVDFQFKPVDPDKLIAAVEKYIS